MLLELEIPTGQEQAREIYLWGNPDGERRHWYGNSESKLQVAGDILLLADKTLMVLPQLS